MSIISSLDHSSEISEDAPYETIGAEYYDSERHPTCAAFGQASLSLLAEHMPEISTDGRSFICDVGAGRSVAAHLLYERLQKIGGLYLVDEAPSMLAWSDRYQASTIKRVTVSASCIDKLGRSFELIIASLGDPYNDEEFWKAVLNSLTSGGTCLFTTPSIEWANTFRRASSQEFEESAFFCIANGQPHYVPSIILPEADQRKLIEKVGLKVRTIDHFAVEELSFVPEKLQGLKSTEPVVALYNIGR